MATPYGNSQEQEQAQWQDPSRNDRESSNFRSVTPAMNNTRGVVRNGNGTASPAPNRSASPRPGSAVEAHYNNRSGTPSRYLGAFNSSEGTQPQQAKEQPSAPSSTGLIRLTLRKPMGIVFEPMYDPNSPSVQRGVRICDLPRTGAAALSRKLEVGDELLSINDKTMSRLSFDEIMDFIIEADPEEVNILFRRPRKEMLHARHGIKTPSANKDSSAGVKWVDDEQRSKRKDKKKSADTRKEKKSSRRSKRDDDVEAESEDQDYRSKKSRRGRKDPYESESFLDILIDTICANPDNVCRDRPRPGEEDDYYSDEDDGTFASRDDSTYLTYESEEQSKKKAASKSKSQNRDDDDDSTYEETEDDTIEEKDKRKKKREKEADRSSPPEEAKRQASPEKKKKPPQKYEDDGTLETVDSADRGKVAASEPEPAPIPLGLAPNPNPEPAGAGEATDTDDTNPAPIRDLEFDDHGADVSVMESLGGPSLLIEKQRQAATMATRDKEPLPDVPEEIIDNFGHDYPLDFGFTREQTIKNDPLRFYTHVVKALLREHEPEKVRLLDRLLAKYKGREDHLVQKLSVRYMKEDENGDNEENEQEDEEDDNFDDAVKQGKNSASANAAIKAAKERMHHDDEVFDAGQWPDKETKESDEEDRQVSGGDEEGSLSASDYSGDSIDGTSPAVIAQVSELLNYVYGKTSVPGQIDRVSTIMRAYEGREAVLLELLETKALIKANREKENAGNLPSFLRNSANAQQSLEDQIEAHGDMPAVTPMATQPQGAAINDDISSMSGVSSPAVDGQKIAAGVLKQISVSTTKGAFSGDCMLSNSQRSPYCNYMFRLTNPLHQNRQLTPTRTTITSSLTKRFSNRDRRHLASPKSHQRQTELRRRRRKRDYLEVSSVAKKARRARTPQ
jgi:hypothetical protein